jgi:hypothetical protein
MAGSRSCPARLDASAIRPSAKVTTAFVTRATCGCCVLRIGTLFYLESRICTSIGFTTNRERVEGSRGDAGLGDDVAPEEAGSGDRRQPCRSEVAAGARRGRVQAL